MATDDVTHDDSEAPSEQETPIEETPEEEEAEQSDETSDYKKKLEEKEKQYAALKKDYDKRNQGDKKLKSEIARLKTLVGEEEEPEPEKDSDIERRISDMDFKIDYGDRLAIVKDDWKDIMENGFEGRTVSDPLIALELAEKRTRVESSSSTDRQAEMSSSSVTNRESGKVTLTDYDKKFGIKPEIKKKYAAYVEGRK